MRLALIIAALLLHSCTSQQKQNDSLNGKKRQDYALDQPESIFTSVSTCNNTKLSNQFDIRTEVTRYKRTGLLDSCSVSVIINDKQSKTVLDSLFISPVICVWDETCSQDSFTSYSTGYNSDRDISDNYFGDIVVIDMNFDNKDDIVVNYDCGISVGNFYKFFIQDNNNKFTLDSYLTDSTTFFPYSINWSKHQIATHVHAGVCCVGEDVYELSKSSNNWAHISHKILSSKDERPNLNK